MNKILSFLKNKFVISAIVVIVVATIFFVVKNTGGKSTLEVFTAIKTTVTEKVSVTGKVAPEQIANIGFEKSGTIAKIYAKIGDIVKLGQTIASLHDETTYASLLSARANLSVAEANLADNQTNTSIEYTNAEKSSIDSARNAYNNASDAILNYADVFFNNGPSGNPEIKLNLSNTQNTDINSMRVKVSTALNSWKLETNTSTSTENAPNLLEITGKYLSTIKDFTTSLSSTVLNYFKEYPNSPLGGAISYISKINSLESGISNAVSLITTAKNNLNSTAPKSTAALQARVEQARADVINYVAQYAKSRVVAPFDGIITRIDPQVGDSVNGNQPEFGVMTNQMFKIEVNVPEADIAKITIGNKAEITLDAYGDNTIFTATVTSIDPAETIIEGVSTYKVTLHFDQIDSRVRSGMTTNIDILTHENKNVIAVPYRAVVDDNGKKSVRLVNPDGKTYKTVPVTVGLKGSDGIIEITSGLQIGDKVVTYAK